MYSSIIIIIIIIIVMAMCVSRPQRSAAFFSSSSSSVFGCEPGWRPGHSFKLPSTFSSSFFFSPSSFLLFFVRVHTHTHNINSSAFFFFPESLSIRVTHSLTHSRMIVKTKCDHHFPSLSVSLLQFIHVDLAPSPCLFLWRDSSSFIASLYFSIRFAVDSLRCVLLFSFFFFFFCFVFGFCFA